MQGEAVDRSAWPAAVERSDTAERLPFLGLVVGVWPGLRVATQLGSRWDETGADVCCQRPGVGPGFEDTKLRKAGGWPRPSLGNWNRLAGH